MQRAMSALCQMRTSEFQIHRRDTVSVRDLPTSALSKYLSSMAIVAGRPRDFEIELTSEGLDIVRHSPPGMIKENRIVGATNEGGEGRSVPVFH